MAKSPACMMLLVACVSLLAASNFGKLQDFYIGTYAINKYVANPSLPESIDQANVFYSSLFNNIKTKDPQTYVIRGLQREDAAANDTNYRYDQPSLDGCDFVFFACHGIVSGRLLLRSGAPPYGDQTATLYQKQWGRWYTKWIVLNSCETLYDMNVSCFSGLHAIVGYRSLSYQYTSAYKCGFLGSQWCYCNSSDIDKDFASRWVNGGETIWNAWKDAVYYTGYVAANKHVNIPGIQPACIYVSPSNLEGAPFDGCNDTYARTYMAPIPNSGGGRIPIL